MNIDFDFQKGLEELDMDEYNKRTFGE